MQMEIHVSEMCSHTNACAMQVIIYGLNTPYNKE